MTTPSLRPVWAEVDLAAVRHNVGALQRVVGSVPLLAVVKADAYGHGAAPVARAAIDAGATMLGVALVEEGLLLRAAGVSAPILVLSEPVADAADSVVEHDLTPAVYTAHAIRAIAAAASRQRRSSFPVHLKIDTGMHRVGCTPDDALAMAQQIVGRSELSLDGVWTHLAVADEQANEYNDRQLDRFSAAVDKLAGHSIAPRLLHAANTAGALAMQRARLDLVRCGIGVYGIAPAAWMQPLADLHPVLSVHAEVSYSKRVGAGEALSYGLRYELDRATNIVTVPIGYADGVPRMLGHNGGEALVRGRRVPIAGTITMDQLMLDLGDTEVDAGEPVVLIGRQDDECITAQEWAERIGTIAYEIVCGIGPRVPRRYLGSVPTQ